MPAAVAGDLAFTFMVMRFPGFRGKAKIRQTSVREDVGRNRDGLDRARIGGRIGIGKSKQQKRKAAENAQPYLSNLPKTPDHLAYQLIMQPKVIMSYGNPCNALQPRGHCDADEPRGHTTRPITCSAELASEAHAAFPVEDVDKVFVDAGAKLSPVSDRMISVDDRCHLLTGKFEQDVCLRARGFDEQRFATDIVAAGRQVFGAEPELDALAASHLAQR